MSFSIYKDMNIVRIISVVTGKKVLNVPSEYNTIQKAVDKANIEKSVCIIEIAPGVYEENIHLYPNIFIHGSSNHVVIKGSINIEHRNSLDQTEISNIDIEGTIYLKGVNKSMFQLNNLSVNAIRTCMTCINCHIVCFRVDLDNQDGVSPCLYIKDTNVSFFSSSIENNLRLPDIITVSPCIEMRKSIISMQNSSTLGCIQVLDQSILEVKFSSLSSLTQSDTIISNHPDNIIQLFHITVYSNGQNIKSGEGTSTRSGVVALGSANKFIDGQNAELTFV